MTKQIKALVFDMDGTLIHFPFGRFGSTWEAVAHASGVFDEFEAKQEKFYNQRELAQQWVEESARLFTGQNLVEVKEKLRPIPYQGNIQLFLAQSNGYVKGCISSGLDVVGEMVGEELGLDFVACTELGVSGGRLTGEIVRRVPLWGKQQLLQHKLREYGLGMRNVAYIGDDENCIPCMKAVAIGVAFNPKTEQTREAADYVIQDFRELEGIL